MSQVETLKHAIFNGEDPSTICDLMIVVAIEDGASDVHLEPLGAKVRLRYRVDGVLREILEYPTSAHPQIVARYKILGNLKMDETRKPQDGRISHEAKGQAFDLRLSTLPTVHGEKIVMRIVDKKKKIPELEKLGLEGKNKKIISRAIEQPNGIILNSGPTGSGKSTTLYAIMKRLNQPQVNIMTFEDPVEIVVDGLNQSQIFPDIGYTFANGLRTALRQDPDIMMVGEIRDQETADIAIEASLTGHLVLSTIHTNSAAETLTRLINLGVKTFLLPATINAIIAQRLVRRIIPEKSKRITFSDLDINLQQRVKHVIAMTPQEEIRERLSEAIMRDPGFLIPDMTKVSHPDQAFEGRIALYEVMEITSGIKDMILAEASAKDIFNAAVKDGMISLEQDGIIRALQGVTSLDEVYGAVKLET